MLSDRRDFGVIEGGSRPELVGRAEELGKLTSLLEAAWHGKGSMVFIAGEAGVGKTRLTRELASIAESKDFQVLWGSSLFESLTPYMPFVEALKTGDMDYLFAEQVPKILAVYLVTNTGILVKEVLRKETRLDSDLFASMLVTVGNFVKESLSLLSGEKKEGTLNRLGYENYQILIESGVDVNLVVVLTGKENEHLVKEMRGILQSISRQYGNIFKGWDGDEGRIEGIVDLLEGLVATGKYDGVFHVRNDPKARRSLLFENVRLGIARRTLDNPILLCLDDLQWADPSSLALMHYVARGAGKHRLLILGMYRPEDIIARGGKPHQLVDSMQLMSREGLLKKVELRRLARQYISPLLDSLLGKTQFNDEFINRIFSESEGNPLFVVELVKMMVDERIIAKDNGMWKLTLGISEVRIPSKVFDVIARRLGRVANDERRILDYASIIGDSFTSSLLAEAMAMKKVSLLEKLSSLQSAHKLIHTHDGKWKFDHTKIQEVLYSHIPQELRREYHSIIAETIEELNKENLDEVIGDLAFHYRLCDNRSRALFYLVRAARKARNEYSNEEAIRFYGEGLEFEEDAQRRCNILEELGALYELVGQYNKSIECYESAHHLAENEPKRAELGARIGSAHCSMGEYDKAVNACAAALKLVEGIESKEKSMVLRVMGNVGLAKGEFEKALGYFGQSLRIGGNVGDDADTVQSLMGIGGTYVRQGLYNKALEAFKQGLVVGRRMGELRYIARCLGNIGALHYHTGQHDEALKYYGDSLEMFERIGDIQGIAYSVNNLGVLHENRGQYERALEYYEKSLEMAQKSGDKTMMAASIHNLGAAHQYLKNYEKAIEHYRSSLKISEEIGHQIGIAYNCCGIAEVYFHLEDWEKALSFCERAYQVSKETGFKQYMAASKKLVGMVYREQKAWKDSIENFEESIGILEDIHMERELAQSHHEFSLAWLGTGNIEEAKKHVLKAIELFRNIKADSDLEIAERTLERVRRGGRQPIQ